MACCKSFLQADPYQAPAGQAQGIVGTFAVPGDAVGFVRRCQSFQSTVQQYGITGFASGEFFDQFGRGVCQGKQFAGQHGGGEGLGHQGFAECLGCDHHFHARGEGGAVIPHPQTQ
ncbi:hypothetical protein D9M69_432190 [compost metagenome]